MPVEPVAYRDGAQPLTGHLVRPRSEPRAAVAVFPTIMNPTPVVMAKAEALTASGYLALVCDFYGETPVDFGHSQRLAKALRADVSAYRRRLRAGLQALSEAAPGVRQCAIGFCLGGQAVLELARDGADLALVASFHGLLDTAAPAGPGAIKARIAAFHGDADALVPRAQVMSFWEEMDRAEANWHFHSYSGVRHGFTNPDAPPAGGPTAYDASADRQSWVALLSLLDEVVG